MKAQEINGRREHGNGMSRNSWNRLQWLRRLAQWTGKWVPSGDALNRMTVDELYAELERLEEVV